MTPVTTTALDRSDILDMMGSLKLFGMHSAFDEVISTAVMRQYEPQRLVSDLLKAEIDEKHARSIKYHLTIARLPLATDIADFAFAGTPINETLVHDLAAGHFLDEQRNCVLVGGTGTGQTHLAIAIARSCIRAGKRGRFFNTLDLVNPLEDETRGGRQGRVADYLARMDLVVLDELGYLPFAQSAGQLLFHLVSRLYERTSVIVTTNLAFQRLAQRLRRRQDDHCAARSAHASLRHRRDRQRELALQEPGLKQARNRARLGSATPTSLRQGERYRSTYASGDRGVKVGRRSGDKLQRRLTAKEIRSAFRRSK